MRTLPFILSLLLLAGCTTSQVSPVPPGSSSIQSNDSDFVVHWSTRPTVIPVNDFFEVDVLLVDRDGTPLEEATLDVDAAMPHHRHGMNHRSHMVHVGPGRWRAEDMLFHMPGSWVLYFDVKQDGIVRRAQVDVEVD
tara:strand:- start:63 stop:473 length:411 start_codon:yes stop_codon:yes gene_type:complete